MSVSIATLEKIIIPSHTIVRSSPVFVFAALSTNTFVYTPPISFANTTVFKKIMVSFNNGNPITFNFQINFVDSIGNIISSIFYAYTMGTFLEIPEFYNLVVKPGESIQIVITGANAGGVASTVPAGSIKALIQNYPIG